MPSFTIRSLKTRMLLLILPPVVLALVALTALAVTRATSQERTSRFEGMTEVARSHANELDADTQRDAGIGHTLASTMEAYAGGDRANVAAILRRTMDDNPQVVGTYVGYVRDGFDGADALHRGEPGSAADGRYGPYWNVLAGKPALDVLVDQETSDYWTVPRDTGKSSVIEPYLYQGALMTSYTSPIRRNGRFVGIAGVDRLLGAVHRDVSKVRILRSGYGFLVSRGGIFVSAPDTKRIGKSTLAKLAEEEGNPALTRVSEAIADGRGGQVETKDPFTGKDVVLSWSPVGTGKWGFVTAVPVAEVLAPVHRLRTTLILLGLLLCALVAGAIYLAASRITKPVTALTRAAERVSEGDVRVELPTPSHDEVGRMGAAFGKTVEYLQENTRAAERVASGDLTVQVRPRSADDALGTAFAAMVATLRTLVGRVGTTAGTLSSSSQQMASTSEEAGRAVGEIAHAVSDVAQGAEQQVRVVASARTATDEVASAVQRSATNAQESAVAAGETRAIAQEGVAAAESATAAMRSVRESSESVAGAIAALSSKSEQIGGIVDTISGIAGQTNLLALNAAIEAARAGEQGRGFAVVAEEVRKLAEESEGAAGKIGLLVREIQAETDHAVRVAQEGAQRTEDGAATVEQTREAFVRIGGSVDGMTARTDQIARAVQQIAVSAERLSREIGEVADVAETSSASAEEVSASTEETSASAQQIAASAQELATTADELDRLVAQFQLV